MRIIVVLVAASLLTGCGATIYGLRVPLVEPSQFSATDAPNITIEDLRPAAERKVHTGGGLLRCERWYGDDTYVPSKLVYLEHLLAERVRQDATVRVQLRRYDTIEYCESQAQAAGAAAAAGASAAATGTATVASTRQVPGGDSVVVRLAGSINGVRFDSTRRFDYGDVWRSPHDSPQYQERMRLAITAIVDEIVTKLPAASRIRGD